MATRNYKKTAAPQIPNGIKTLNGPFRSQSIPRVGINLRHVNLVGGHGITLALEQIVRNIRQSSDPCASALTLGLTFTGRKLNARCLCGGRFLEKTKRKLPQITASIAMTGRYRVRCNPSRKNATIKIKATNPKADRNPVKSPRARKSAVSVIRQGLSNTTS